MKRASAKSAVGQLDLDTMLEVLQTVSGETDPRRVMDAVLRLGLTHAGAERGLLILPGDDGFRIEAEAEASSGGVRVALRQSAITPDALPESVLREVLRTRETVVLQDAAAEPSFSADEHVRRRHARSVLCMPLLRQDRLVGLIYLEHTLAPDVFTPARIAALEVLRSAAAISLENARAYRDLQVREAKLRRLVDSNIVGVAVWHADGRVLEVNDAYLGIIGYGREELLSGRVLWTDYTPVEWHEDDARALEEVKKVGTAQAHQREYIRKDGTRARVLAAGAIFPDSPDEGVAFVLDLTEHEWAERAQRASALESRLIMDTIPGMVGVLTVTGEIEALNRQLLDYFGQSLEELRHWGTNGTVHPDDLPHVAEVFGRSIEAGTPYNILQRFRRSDGAYRWFENRGFPLRNEKGRIERWCVLLEDIDDRKRAEDALAASERRLKLTIDAIPALAWSARPDGSADFFNQHYLDFIGLPTEQASGWGWTAAVHPDDMPGLAAVWQRILASEAPGEAEARLRRHDGAYRWFLFRASPLRDDSGQIAKWFGVNIDIEDRKRVEAELRRAYDSFADAQRLSRTGSFITDLVADDHNWSAEAYRIFDFEPETRVTVQRMRDVVHPNDLPSFDAMIARGMSGVDVTFAFRIVTARGALKHVRGVAHVIEEVEGRPMFVGALQDVTETVVAEEALNRTRSELAHVTRVTALSALTASIAHEVNQPLSGIITNAGTCLRMLDADPPNLGGARETARRTIRDAHRATDVISRLRAMFSRKEFTLESMDFSEAAREVLALSARDLDGHRVIVRPELADDLPSVVGDRVQLQQVVLNLLLNAAEAMSEVHDRARMLVIRTERDGGDHVRLTVRDTGPGVASQIVGRLFDAFYTTKREGMGIGLAVSRSIIERHGGRLWAEPNDGPGATFTFSVPCRPEGASTDTKV